MKRLSIRSIGRPSKRLIILVSIGVVLLGLAIAYLWQANAWQGYMASSDARYQQIKGETLSDLSQVKDRDGIKHIATKLDNDRQELCQAPALSGLWVQLSADARKYQQDCQARSDRLAAASRAAERLHQRLVTESAVVEAYHRASAGLKKAVVDDYAAQKELWQQTEKDLLAIEADESYQKVMQSQQQAIQSISKRYDDIIKADKAKKRNQFDDAAVELREAYSRLESIKDQASSSYQGLVTTLYDAVDKL